MHSRCAARDISLGGGRIFCTIPQFWRVIPTRMRGQGPPAISRFRLPKGHLQGKQGLVERLCLPQGADDQRDMSDGTIGHGSCSFLSPRVCLHNSCQEACHPTSKVVTSIWFSSGSKR